MATHTDVRSAFVSFIILDSISRNNSDGPSRRSWSMVVALVVVVVASRVALRALTSSRQIEESISILNFFPTNRGVDFYFEFLPAKLQIEESISILNDIMSIYQSLSI